MLHAKAKKKTAITAHRTTLHTIAAKHTHITSNTFSLTHTRTHSPESPSIQTHCTLHTKTKSHRQKHTTTNTQQQKNNSHSNRIQYHWKFLIYCSQTNATPPTDIQFSASDRRNIQFSTQNGYGIKTCIDDSARKTKSLQVNRLVYNSY